MSVPGQKRTRLYPVTTVTSPRAFRAYVLLIGQQDAHMKAQLKIKFLSLALAAALFLPAALATLNQAL